ncbi:MAG: WS/DGAT/MGAT family O-acyltransferase [Acidimicrobiales bacterium]
MRQLSGQDASFLYFETSNAPMHIGSVSIYDQSTAPGGKVGFKQIMAHIENRLHMGYAFRRKIQRVPFDMDHPYWVDDPDFDLEFHVRHIALPKPGDWRQLCIQVARLHSRPLDEQHPLWELYVIEGLDHVEGVPPGSFALMMKIHHAAVDGVSGTELTTALHDLTAEPAPIEAEPWLPRTPPSPEELVFRANMTNLMQPLRFAELLSRTMPAVVSAAPLMRQQNNDVPRTRFNGTVGRHRVWDARKFPLAGFRSAKSVIPDATVNDSVLTVVGGALRRYLLDKDELPDRPLLAMAPISVRSDDEKGDQGNQVAAMTVALGTDVDDPIERLHAVRSSTSASKELTNAIGARLMTDYTQFIPSATAAIAARVYSEQGMANRTDPAVNCVVTNVPGPQVPLYMCGSKLLAQYGMGPIQDGMGLIHAVFSYCGEVMLSATASRDRMPDPGFYAECLQDSFDEFVAATGANGSGSKRQRAGAGKAAARS